MRLAYSLLVLAALTAIIQLGSPNAATRSPAPEPPGRATAAVWPVDAREPQAVPAPRHTEAPDELDTSASSGAAARASTPPVFRRPAPAIPGGVQRAATQRVCGDLQGFSSSNRVLFPLPEGHSGSYEDTWGAPRPQGGHEGTDLMVPTGTPEYAITDGTIVPVAGSNENGWNSLGGYAVMLEAAYSVGPVRKGDLFYYAHLKRESDLEIGDTVSAGQVIGYAGDTGQGPEVTSGLFPPHLHFGWYDASGARSNLDSGAMNPFPLLEWIEANGGALRGGSDARYCEAPESGTPSPSVDVDRWPAPKEPGVRPDLSADSPEPSPVARKVPHGRETRTRPAGPSGPERPGGRPPESRSGESNKRKPAHRESPHSSPRAGERDESRSHYTPSAKNEPREGRETTRRGEKRENRKVRDARTETPPAEPRPEKDASEKDASEKDALEKDASKRGASEKDASEEVDASDRVSGEEGGERGPRRPGERPEREPVPPAPGAPDGGEGAEPGDAEPLSSSESAGAR